MASKRGSAKRVEEWRQSHGEVRRELRRQEGWHPGAKGARRDGARSQGRQEGCAPGAKGAGRDGARSQGRQE
jgi:hypothetical protein